MSLITPDGKITQLSVSQVEKADPKQTGGCLRRWWFETPQGLKPEQSYEKNEGTAGHELLRRYFLYGENPKGRTLMGKAVTGAILKGELPAPSPDLIVEKRFSGQDMRDDSRCECGHPPEMHGGKGGCQHVDASGCTCDYFRPAWVPLDVKETLHLAGLPWDGAIDLVVPPRDAKPPRVWDNKFSSDPEQWAKKNSELIKTVQMPLYAHSQRPYYPEAREFELVHHYVSKKGVLSFLRSAVVTVDQIDERIADIVAVVERMKAIAPAANQDDVPASPSEATCGAWSGCPHQSICSSFQKRNTHPRGATPMALTAEEAALFDSIPADDSPPVEVVPMNAEEVAVSNAEVALGNAHHAPIPEDPDEAALKAQLEAAQKALAEKQAKRKNLIVERTPEAGAVPPPPAPAPLANSGGTCKCGTLITSENGSKLQSGDWKHVGCKLDAPPPPPPKARATTKKAADAPPPPPPPAPAPEAKKTPPPAPAAFAGESATDRAAQGALDAMKNAPIVEKPSNRPVAAPTSVRDAAAEFLRKRFAGDNETLNRDAEETSALIHAAVRILTN